MFSSGKYRPPTRSMPWYPGGSHLYRDSGRIEPPGEYCDLSASYFKLLAMPHYRHNGLLLTFVFLIITGTTHTAAADSPNFIVILSDDQSWVGTSTAMIPGRPDTRSDYYQTPSIDRLVQQGMLFTHGYSPAPFCCPTRRSLQIGQTPARHIYLKDQENWTTIYRQQLNIPRLLKTTNPRYQVAHFGKWDHRFDDVSPADMGYDVSDGVTTNGTGSGKGTGGPAAQQDPKLIFGITDRACKFMEQQVQDENPFYLQVSHYAVHLDIFYRDQTLAQVKQRKAGRKHNMPQFAAMTADLDTGIGLLMKKVKSLGLLDNTYIFFLSDNGGRNTLPKSPPRRAHRNYPLRDGKGSMYEGGLRVPFVVSGPGIEPGSVSHVPVTGLDIMPTLATLAGYPDPLPGNVDGGSIVNVLRQDGKGTVPRQYPFLIFHQAVSRDAETSLRLGHYKLVKQWHREKLELFDLSTDLGEEKDLSAKLPEKTDELHRLMTRFLEEVNAETRRTGK